MLARLPLFFAEADPGLFEQVTLFFKEGGFFMIMLGITSLVALAAILFKFLSLARKRIIPEEMVLRVDEFEGTIRRGADSQVLQVFEKGESTLARLCAVTVGMRGRPQSEIAEVVQADAREELLHMQAGMTVIDVIIAVAPLLGLLGTASGLVVVFSGLEAEADRVTIALGIGRALKTTIVGLAIAVPSIIAQGYFQRKIDTYAARLEVLMTKLAHICERTPWPDADSSPRD